LTPRGPRIDPEGKIVLSILAVALFLLTPWVHGDGIGSVAILHSVIVEHNLDLADEFRYLSRHIQADAGGIPGALLDKSDYTPGFDPLAHTASPDPVTGRVPFFSSIGPPIVWAPAYLAAHAIVKIGRALGAPLRDDGYGGLYYLAIALASLVCGIAGLLLAYRLASLFTPQREAAWATLAIAWASPLIYYLYMAPSYCHAITTLTAGAFFLYWWTNRGSAGAGTWFKWGLLAGLLFIVRWNDIVLAVPVFTVEVVKLLRRKAPGGPRGAGRLLPCLGAAFAGFLLIASIQLVTWQYFHARPLIRYPRSAIGFWPEGLWGTFVSARHGLFIWTPIIILAVAGLFRLFRRDRELASVSIATVALLAASNCTIFDWWGGASFGMRRLISATPLFVLGLSVLFDDVRLMSLRRRSRGSRTAAYDSTSLGTRIVAPAVCIVFSVWNVLLLAQYSLGMIGHTVPVSFATITSNQPRVILRMIELLKGLIF
jgi:hypothetical protein